MAALPLSMLEDEIDGDAGAWSVAGRDRYCFAIQPEPSVLDSIAGVTASLVKRHGLRGRPLPLDALSIPILGVGPAEMLTPDQVAIAARAAREVALQPFAVTLTEATSIRRWDGNALVLRCGEGSDIIGDLAHALFERMLAGGFEPRGTTESRPSLTLLHDPVRVPPTRLAWPIHFEVMGFSLTRTQPVAGAAASETFALGG